MTCRRVCTQSSHCPLTNTPPSGQYIPRLSSCPQCAPPACPLVLNVHPPLVLNVHPLLVNTRGGPLCGACGLPHPQSVSGVQQATAL